MNKAHLKRAVLAALETTPRVFERFLERNEESRRARNAFLDRPKDLPDGRVDALERALDEAERHERDAAADLGSVLCVELEAAKRKTARRSLSASAKEA